MKGRFIRIFISSRARTNLVLLNPGNNPLLSVKLINELCLWSSIFDVPAVIASNFPSPPGPPAQSLAAASILEHIVRPVATHAKIPPIHHTLLSAFTHDSSTPPRLFLACALTPYRHVTYNDAKGKTHPASEAALRDAVKLGMQNHYLDGIPALFSSADLLQNPSVGGDKERIRIGRMSCAVYPCMY